MAIPPDTLELVRRGSSHLQLQRPLAAWACWQEALRADPEQAAARQALDALETAEDLPAAARASYKFQAPADPDRRARWDETLRGRDLQHLDAAAAAFADLAESDAGDADARLNRALCLAWLGRNAEAVGVLEGAINLLAPVDPGRAADAWLLAEVLRFGGGAEALADDLRVVWTLAGSGIGEAVFENWPGLVAVAVPDDPLTGAPVLASGRVYEWRDRDDADGAVRPSSVPRALATVVRAPGSVRLSATEPGPFARLDEFRFLEQAEAFAAATRQAGPLPLAWADAPLGGFRLPAGLDGAARAALHRGVIEHYYENLWVTQPRTGLGGRSPVGAARLASAGDAASAARLAGLIRFREQLGARAGHLALYQGYPFDRLRRRLGLLAAETNPATLDPADVSCMGEAELDELDPEALDDARLADAFESAAPFGDDPRTARFAAALAGRPHSASQGLDAAALYAPLVREALRMEGPLAALDRLEQGRARFAGAGRRTLTVWAAEVHARAGEPEAALALYQSLLEPAGFETALVALDGAETLLDFGAPDASRQLLTFARDHGGPATSSRARRRLGLD